MMRELLLDFDPIRNPCTNQLSLESDVALLTSCDGSGPSTLGYDGSPTQMSADVGVSWSTSDLTRINFTENGKRFVQSNNFGLITKFDALHHPCHILVHWCGCCVYGRYWSNVFDHRTRCCTGHGGSCRCVQPTHWRTCCSSDPLRTRTSWSKVQLQRAFRSGNRPLARLWWRWAACSHGTRSSSSRTARENEPSIRGLGAALARTAGRSTCCVTSSGSRSSVFVAGSVSGGTVSDGTVSAASVSIGASTTCSTVRC